MTLFKKFEDEKARYEDRIEALREVILHAEIEISEHRLERENILRDVMSDGSTTDVDARIEAAAGRIQALHTRVAYTHEEQRKQLAAMLEYVSDIHEKAATKKEKEFNEALLTLQRMKLDYLAAAGRLGELNREFNDINKAANECRSQAGADPVRYSPIKSSMSTSAHPSYNGYEAASFNTLIIPEWLYDEAQRGNTPNWGKEMLRNG